MNGSPTNLSCGAEHFQYFLDLKQPAEKSLFLNRKYFRSRFLSQWRVSRHEVRPSCSPSSGHWKAAGRGCFRPAQAVAPIRFLILTRLSAATASVNSHPTISRLPQPHLPQPRHDLRSSEKLLHLLPSPLAHSVAFVPRRRPIHRAAPPAYVLHRMRRHVQILHLLNKLPRVVPIVS